MPAPSVNLINLLRFRRFKPFSLGKGSSIGETLEFGISIAEVAVNVAKDPHLQFGQKKGFANGTDAFCHDAGGDTTLPNTLC
jgi:hypothetical protein